MTNTPCKGCPDRYVGCHAECLRYEEWKIIHQAEVDQAREAKRELYASPISESSRRKGWQNQRYKMQPYRKTMK